MGQDNPAGPEQDDFTDDPLEGKGRRPGAAETRSGLGQGLVEVGDDVVDGLDAHRDADHVGAGAGLH